MFQSIFDWIFHRALRISSASVKKIASMTGQDPAKVVAVNDAVAGIVADQAVQAAQKAAGVQQ
jgi:hypothetical protein